MSDDLREREDHLVSSRPTGPGVRSDVGASDGGAPPLNPNRSGSGADTGEGEPGHGASSDDPTEWVRSAPG